jgi:hypothetical protein
MLAKRPTDRRAGCGKTARPVRREGQGKTPCSYPYMSLLAIPAAQATQSHIKATPKRVDSQGIATPKPPQGYLHATLKPP